MSDIPFTTITGHNQASFIRDVVESALSQSFAPAKIVVVDDASSDGSPEILEAYGNRTKFAGFQTNQGATPRATSTRPCPPGNTTYSLTATMSPTLDICIPKMVDGLFKMIARGRSGIYLDGKKLRFGRYVIIGSPVFFWFKSAYRAKHFVTAGVLARGWEMFAAAGARKAVTSISGRKSPPILPLTPRIMGNLPWKIPRRVQNYSAPWHTLDTLDPTGIANIPPDLPAAGEFRTK